MRLCLGTMVALLCHALALLLIPALEAPTRTASGQVTAIDVRAPPRSLPRPAATPGTSGAPPGARPARLRRSAPLPAPRPGARPAPAEAPGADGTQAPSAPLAITPGSLHCPAWAPCPGRGAAMERNAGRRSAGEEDLRGEMLARIMRSRYYPELARRRGIEGEVLLRFVIGSRGEALDVRVLRSAGPLLDEAARASLAAAAPLPLLPGPQEVSILYRLHEAELR